MEELGRTEQAVAITSAVINLGQCLGMQVIAEGVETAAQEAELLRLGCTVAQGYLYSNAMPAEAVSLALMQWAQSREKATA